MNAAAGRDTEETEPATNPPRGAVGSSLLPWIALILVWFLWGSTYIGIRFAVQTIPPFLMSGSRYFLAGVLLLAIICSHSRTWPRVTRNQLRSTAIGGAALLLGGNGLLSYGEQHLQSGVAALLVATVPILMILEAALLKRTRLSIRSALAISLGTAGVIIIFGAPDSSIDFVAAAWVLAGACFWALGSVYLAKADMPDNPLVATAFEMTIGGALLILTGGLSGELAGFSLSAVSQSSITGWIWLLLPGSLVGFTAYTYALRTLPTNKVATYAYVNPVVAVILGSAFGDQPITLGILAGGGAVVGAVVITLVKVRSSAPSTPTVSLKPRLRSHEESARDTLKPRQA